MATIRSFSDMLNQKPAQGISGPTTTGTRKLITEKPGHTGNVSPWTQLFKLNGGK